LRCACGPGSVRPYPRKSPRTGGTYTSPWPSHLDASQTFRGVGGDHLAWGLCSRSQTVTGAVSRSFRMTRGVGSPGFALKDLR